MEKPVRSIPWLQKSRTLRGALRRVRYRRSYARALRSTIYTLITVAAIAILLATLWLPVLQIHGSSMSPTLQEGDIVVSVKNGAFEPGQIIAFYYNKKILVKRVIANAGDWVDMDDEGNQEFVLTDDFSGCGVQLSSYVKPTAGSDHPTIAVSEQLIEKFDGYARKNKISGTEVEILAPDQVDFLRDKTDWDLTLFTCTYGGGSRRVLRCSLLDG